MSEFPEEVLKVQGTALLCSAELRPEIPVVGFDGPNLGAEEVLLFTGELTL